MTTKPDAGAPGETIRALRQRVGLTLNEVSERTGLAVSTLSKLERGHVSLSYDKLALLSRGLGVDMAELLAPAPHAKSTQGGGLRVIHRAGEGQLVETLSYRQTYLATELLNKRFTPLIAELRARTMEAFIAEFGDFIRHPGQEFVYVLEGEVEFHSERYAPARLKAGDSVYFDSEMGHAYLKGCDEPCRILGICAPREEDETMMETFISASERLATASAPAAAPSHQRRAATRRSRSKPHRA